MKKDVLITISGTQVECEDLEANTRETIEIVNPATYFFKDGLHYVFFEEVHEGTTSVTKNKIVYKENESLEVIKKGVTNSDMKFHLEEQHLTNYETPYGEMVLGVTTHSLEATIEESMMVIKATYELAVNCEAYAECEIILTIKEKSQGI